MFTRLVGMIGDHEVFYCTPGKRAKAPVTHHLGVTLYYLGINGNGASMPMVAILFGLSAGTVRLYVTRTIAAILPLHDTVIQWPDEAERIEIASRIESSGYFRFCVGSVDGTLFPFENKPSLNGEDYWTRKGCYALNAQIVCDDIGLKN